jgi:stage V sporulation protein G
MLEISDIRIRKILQEGRLRAVVSLTIDNSVAVHDIKLVQGDERMFVAMPSRRDESGTFRDIIHPINPEARTHIETMILRAYDEHLAAEEATVAMIGEETFMLES